MFLNFIFFSSFTLHYNLLFALIFPFLSFFFFLWVPRLAIFPNTLLKTMTLTYFSPQFAFCLCTFHFAALYYFYYSVSFSTYFSHVFSSPLRLYLTFYFNFALNALLSYLPFCLLSLLTLITSHHSPCAILIFTLLHLPIFVLITVAVHSSPVFLQTIYLLPYLLSLPSCTFLLYVSPLFTFWTFAI